MTGIVNGLFAGRAGISSHGTAIAVASDNIANSSTVGYKTSRAEFEDIISGGQTAGRTIGSGSQVRNTTNIFTQGTLEFTSRPLDLAIDGNGLFALADGATRFYTRAGNFKVDSAGNLVDQGGKSVLGFPQNGDGSLQPLNIRSAASTDSSTIQTGNVDVDGNLNSNDASNGLPGVAPATFAALNTAANFISVVDVFDSLGNSHTLNVAFFKTADGAYTVRGYVDGGDVTGGTAGVPFQLQGGGADAGTNELGITFGTTGALSSADNDLTFVTPWGNGSDATQTFTLDVSGFTQFASPNNILALSQDGQGVGTVVSVDVASDGSIFAQLDNGQTTSIGTVGVVNFANPEGLQRIGGNLLQESTSSGEPIVGRPSSGTFGSIQAGALELSTVDLSTQFVSIITLQRGFQASSRIITTIDNLLNEILQLA